MSTSKRNLKSRLRTIEEGRGAGSVAFTFPNGGQHAFTFSRQDRVQILVANFELERARRSGRTVEPRNPRATAVAKLIRKAATAEPDSGFWRSCGLGIEADEVSESKRRKLDDHQA